MPALRDIQPIYTPERHEPPKPRTPRASNRIGRAMEQKKMLGKNGFKYRQQYGVIVMCSDEQHQKQIFEWLKGMGNKVRVVTV